MMWMSAGGGRREGSGIIASTAPPVRARAGGIRAEH
jgi:hypothetical protein